MTQKSTDFSALELTGEKRISSGEIADSFRALNEDIEQVGKLKLEEKELSTQFFMYLQKYASVTPLIPVSASALPTYVGEVAKAYLYPTGRMLLELKDGNTKFLDLTDSENCDLMLAVAQDIVPKLYDLTKLRDLTTPKQPKPRDLTVKEPAKPSEATVETPIQSEIAPEKPAEKFEVSAKPVLPQLPAPQVLLGLPYFTLEDESKELQGLSADEKTKVEEIIAEVLGNLELLSNEVFEHEPISRFFDDWMVNLRQVIMLFESNGVIATDETFTKEYTQIFSDIEEELAKRLLDDAELETSSKTLAENRQLLGEIDAGYTAETKDLVVRGKSAIDFLIRNVQHLDEELTQIQQIKTSYLHPLKRRQKEQRQAELKTKLRDAKKRLAVAVQNSSVEKKTFVDVDAQYAEQTKELKEKRKKAIQLLTENVRDLDKELDRLIQTKGNSINFVKNAGRDAEIFAATQKYNEAKRSLALAQESSDAELRKLDAEYAEKKKATLGKMQVLEKEIAIKKPDKSVEARKAATKALEEAVKALIKRRTEPQPATDEDKAASG